MVALDVHPPEVAPFSLAHQLYFDFNATSASCSGLTEQYLPGHPSISLENRPALLRFLYGEFCSDDLDRISDKLWWMSKQDSSNISPLHQQRVKRRTIIITEDPKLHLVWIHDRIFIKPLPRYIMSYNFWQDYINGRDTDSIRRAALGYLRTYFYLVKYESDFRIAQDASLQLIPRDVSWEQFSNFVSDLAGIPNCDVSARYTYGEIRLTRLNFFAPFLLRQSYYQRVEYQSGAYFARFYGPILFVIGVASIVLSGLQVIVAVKQDQPQTDGRSLSLSTVAFFVSVAMILCFCLVLSYLCAVFLYRMAKEWNYAIRDRLRILEEGGAGTTK